MSEADVINRRTNLPQHSESSDSNEIENDEEAGILQLRSQSSGENNHPNEVQTIKEAYEKAGGTGRFHAFMLISSIIALNSMGVFTFAITFLELEPTYKCTFLNPETQEQSIQQCNYETVCLSEDPNLIAYEVDQESIYSLYNWNQQVNMHCVPRSYIGSLGTMMFLGCAFSSFVMPFTGDLFGRWNSSQFLGLLTLPVWYTVIYADSFAAIQFACFWAGLLSLLRFTNLFILMNEFMNEKHAGVATSVFMSGDSFMGFYIIGYLYFIGKDIVAVQQISVYLTILSLALFHFIPESPKWLISVGRYDEARESLKSIARINGCSTDQFDMPFKEEIQEAFAEKATAASSNSGVEATSTLTVAESEQKKYCSIFDSKEMLINFWILALFWSASSINFYTANFYMPYVPGDVFVNTFYSSLSENVANLSSGIIFGMLAIRPSFFIGYVMAAIGGLLIMTAPEGGLMAFYVLLAKFAITYTFNIAYMSTPKFFPENVTTTIWGYLNTVARFLSSLAPLIAVQPAPMPMMSFTVLSVVAAIGVQQLNTDKVKQI